MSAAGTWYPLVPTADIAPGEMHAATAGTMQVVVYNVDGEFYATDNICSHAHALLSEGWLDGHVVECPLHAGQFDVRSGKALCEPLTRDITSLETQVRDGQVEVLVRAADPTE